jgi:D-3-phosphoglycerate dehydrogenase
MILLLFSLNFIKYFLSFFCVIFAQNINKMIRILVNDGIHPDGKLLLDEAGYEVEENKIEQNDLKEGLPSFDAILVRSATKVRKDLIDACPNLKLIGRGGVGMDNIDVEYARSKGIKVINTPAASSQSVAELSFAHIFSLSRSLHLSNREMPANGDSKFKQLKSEYSKGIQVSGKTLGIIGFGRIGQALAKIGVGLGMRILPVDVYIDQASIEVPISDNRDVLIKSNHETVEMDEMLSKSDIVSIHIPFSGGKPIIGEEEISKMKDGAILINTARGGAVDEDALLSALESGKLYGAGLDVFENEPTPKNELLNHQRISVSPHIGASTIEAQSNIGLELAEKIMETFGG